VFRKLLICILLLCLTLPLSARRNHSVIPDSLQTLTIDADGISFRLRRVEGGSFIMGATVDQTDKDVYTDKPAHMVFLSPFYMAETEVTWQLWHQVMPEHASLHPKGYPYNPIAHVSWNDCQEFLRRLDSITGLPFRLPTEAEWEYSARGGNRSRHYRYAGGDEPDSVGWTYSCSGNWSHPVARKRPNELGLFDMTGNVAEWCEDWYAPYTLGTAPDPCVCDSGQFRIARGGSYDDCIANSHLSIRRWYKPETATGYIGFRIAMTLPNDPMMQAQEEEPALTKKFRIKGRKLTFTLVPAETPYYISDEIPAALWRKMMQQEPPEKAKNIAVGMSQAKRTLFAEYCSRETKQVMSVASAEQIVTAEQQGLIEPFLPESKSKRKNQSVRQIQQKRSRADRLSPWAELIGLRVAKPDDPILLQFKKADDESRPLRLVILVR